MIEKVRFFRSLSESIGWAKILSESKPSREVGTKHTDITDSGTLALRGEK